MKSIYGYKFDFGLVDDSFICAGYKSCILLAKEFSKETDGPWDYEITKTNYRDRNDRKYVLYRIKDFLKSCGARPNFRSSKLDNGDAYTVFIRVKPNSKVATALKRYGFEDRTNCLFEYEFKKAQN